MVQLGLNYTEKQGSWKLRQPTGQRQSNAMTQPKNISIGPILFLYYEECLVSSNLNSNLLRLHCAHPNVHTMFKYVPAALSNTSETIKRPRHLDDIVCQLDLLITIY